MTEISNTVRRKPSADGLRCSFTGYRPAKMPFGYDEEDPACIAFKCRLREKIEALIGEGYAHFLSGGALGMDMFAAESVLSLRERYPWIVLEMVVPFDGQADTWPEHSKSRYRGILQHADIITCTAHQYDRLVMSRRNRYLVDNADLLLAAYDGQSGGTKNTIRYAEELGIPVSCIRPDGRDTESHEALHFRGAAV